MSASDVVGEGKGFVIGNYECELQELQDEKMNPFISQPVNAVEITKSMLASDQKNMMQLISYSYKVRLSQRLNHLKIP